MTGECTMSEHIAELNRDDVARLRDWLETPNGGHRVPQKPRGVPYSSTRVTFEAVQGGGILVRMYDYSEGPEHVDTLSQAPHEIVAISKDGGLRRKCFCGEIISLNRDRSASGFDMKKTLAATNWLAGEHVKRGNAYAAKRKEKSGA